MPPLSPPPPAESAAIAVIDTNVLLDWLVFEDPSAAALGKAVVTGQLRWIGTAAMLAEWADVLARSVFDERAARRPIAATLVERHCVLLADPSVPAAGRLLCSDADDQKFIDLAMTHPSRWLFSRDKALLRLARKARPRGVEVLTPSAWAALGAPPRG